jgi:hypothetical protein
MVRAGASTAGNGFWVPASEASVDGTDVTDVDAEGIGDAASKLLLADGGLEGAVEGAELASCGPAIVDGGVDVEASAMSLLSGNNSVLVSPDREIAVEYGNRR